MSTTVTIEQVAGPTVTIEQSGQQNITVQPAPVMNVEVAIPGIQGPAGTPISYTHTQGSASDTWVVNHNLGFRPHCVVFSVGGAEVEAGVTHTSVNQTVISFVTPASGTARFV